MTTLTINIPGDRDKLYEVIYYPAGEIQVRLTTEGVSACTGMDEYHIVANPIPDLIELAQLKSALDGLNQGHCWTELHLSYLPYGRADRRFVPGDSFGLEVFANLINSLAFDSIETFDVHSVIAHNLMPRLWNEGPVYNGELEELINFIGREGLALIAPDKGASTRYDFGEFKLPVLVGEKLRDPATGKLSGFSISTAIAQYDKALIVDDICDGGGTFIGLAEAIREIDPEVKLYLYVSHGIFSQGLDKLHQTFDQVFVSDYSFQSEYSETFEDLGGNNDD